MAGVSQLFEVLSSRLIVAHGKIDDAAVDLHAAVRKADESGGLSGHQPGAVVYADREEAGLSDAALCDGGAVIQEAVAGRHDGLELPVAAFSRHKRGF